MAHFRYHRTPFVPDSRAIYAFSKTVYDEASDFLHVIELLYPLVRESSGTKHSSAVRDVAAVDVDNVHEHRLTLGDPGKASTQRGHWTAPESGYA